MQVHSTLRHITKIVNNKVINNNTNHDSIRLHINTIVHDINNIINNALSSIKQQQ